jgi:cytochrome P450
MGNAFALLQVKTILAKLLSRYELALGDDPVVAELGSLVVGPRPPLRIHYQRRRDAGAR